MFWSRSLRRTVITLAVSTSSLALVGSAHAQEAVVAPITVAPAASLSFVSTGEPVSIRVTAASSTVPADCRTPCTLMVAPGAHTLESGAPHATHENELLQAGAHAFEVRPHGPGYGVGLGLTISGSILVVGALGTTVGFTAAGGLFGLVVVGLYVGAPVTLVGLGLLIPGAIVLSNNGPARIERVPGASAPRARRRREGFGLASSMVHDEQGAAFSLVGFAF